MVQYHKGSNKGIVSWFFFTEKNSQPVITNLTTISLVTNHSEQLILFIGSYTCLSGDPSKGTDQKAFAIQTRVLQSTTKVNHWLWVWIPFKLFIIKFRYQIKPVLHDVFHGMLCIIFYLLLLLWCRHFIWVIVPTLFTELSKIMQLMTLLMIYQ